MNNSTATSIQGAGDMPEDSRVTLCPQCQTAFRVTSAQLGVASGRVRCGSCLHVFQADQHWAGENIEINPATDDTDREDAASHSGAATSPEPGQVSSPAAASGSIMEFSDAFLELDGKTPQRDSLSDIAVSHEDNSDDEQWARQILEAEESSTRESKNQLLDAIMAAPEQAKISPSPASEQLGAEKDYQQSKFQTTEGWMAELLGGTEQTGEHKAPPLAPAAAAFDPLEEPDQDYVPEVFRKKNRLIDGIQADPLEMHFGRHFTPWMRQGLYIGGIVLALVFLCGQYAWHNSQHLARDPAYQALFARFCQFSGCAMPAEQDIARIKNSNLVVLKHPRSADALLLDTIITNYAGFEQAYPRLYVEFSDLQDQPVTSRIFEPNEYLRGDLEGSTLMPVRRPVHLSLELVDPGERAVNYKIRLLTPGIP